MGRRLRGTAFALGVLAAAAQPASGQTKPDEGTIDLEVTAKRLDAARSSIQPSLGGSKYDFTPRIIQDIPRGENAPLNDVLLRAPGVVQDSFGQIHVRGDHSNLQYRLDGVQLPEGLSLFNQVLATRYANQMSLITGSLPAQYGFRNAGIVDIAVKSGSTDPGAEASFTTGSRDYMQPAFSYGGRSGAIDYFVTGQYLHNNIGIENPQSTWAPIHDATDQWHALAKITGIVDDQTRLSFVAGTANAAFQIPQRPGVPAEFTVNGTSSLNSALLDQRQWENTYFGMLSLQKHYDTLDFQLAGFTRFSKLTYQPDPLGDLVFNGIAPWAQQRSFAVGAQGDASWKAAADHTIRGGFLVQRERATSYTNANVLQVDANGDPINDRPFNITYGADIVGWLFGVYLQDEWRPTPTLTVNFGLRFDLSSAQIQENQVSPRINVVWRPNEILTAHAGYARYFTPPSLAQVNASQIVATLGTTAQPEVLRNAPVKAERMDYFDAGFEVKPLPGLRFGFDAYYKIVNNLLDEGQFGAPIILTSFNYANANVYGFELTASYDQGPWAIYGNLAWNNALGTRINSAQFNLEAAELAFISRNYIMLDHAQLWTASAGASYIFNYGTDHATRVSADMLYGSGLPRTVVTPNDTPGNPYATFNLSLTQKIPVPNLAGTQLRFDLINVFDTSYQLRDGTGVGVGAPQFGLRRTFLVGLTQRF